MGPTRLIWIACLSVASAFVALASTASASSDPSVIAVVLRNGIGFVNPKDPGSERTLNQHGVDGANPEWSPNGENLAYFYVEQKTVDGTNKRFGHIRIVDRDNHTVGDIRFPGVSTSDNTKGVEGGQPTWGPSGTEIAHYCYEGDVYIVPTPPPLPPHILDYPAPNLCVTNLISGNTNLVAESNANLIMSGEISWSADGHRIAVTAESEVSPSFPKGVYTVKASGGSLSLLAQNAIDESYSPNGQKIAYQSTAGDGWTVVADDNGSNPENVVRPYDASHGDYPETYPAFSPDSKDLAITAVGDNGNYDLFEVAAKAGGSALDQYTHTSGDDERDASWAPPVTKCTVPKLKGKSYDDAKEMIQLAACSLGKVKGSKKGKVVKQSPAANHNVEAGSKVDITLAKPKHHGHRS